MNSDGYPIASTFPDGATTDAVVSLDETASIELGSGEINIIAPNVFINGVPITGEGGFVTNPLSEELNANDYDIMNAGTILATSFVKNGGTSQQYLMGDGSSLQYSANSGNSNFYLYDSGIDQDPTPPNGFITYNAVEQKQATEIYISHRTRDNIDIEIFYKSISQLNDVYIQDQSNSDNNITYNITGTPTIVNQAQITIPVNTTSSNGTGSVSFGNGHNILLSFFTNSIETDGRITTLEAKTQNMTATPNDNTLNGYTTVILREAQPDFFLVKGDGAGDLKFAVGRTSMTCGENMNMANNLITALGAPVNPNDAARKAYVDDAITPLATKTQNISATASQTVFDKNSSFVLRVADADSFVIRNDDSPASTAKFIVSNTSAQIVSVPLLMNNQKITNLAEPTDAKDAATKNYVDTGGFVKAGTLVAGSVPYLTSTSTLSGATKNLFVHLGNSTIQSAIDAATAGGATGGAVQVSSGGSTENIICPRQNYTLVGTICPPFTQTTQITGNLTIGSAAFLSTRVRVSHMKFEGNLIFDNSTNQQLRTYFFNCDWNGTVTFPTSAATGTNGTAIYFDGCSFSGASTITIPNQNLYTIFFTRCAFIGQTITNALTNPTRLIFTDCSYLPTLTTLGNCILNGLNTTLTATQGNYGSIVLGGTASQLLLGNGTTIPTTTYVSAVNSLVYGGRKFNKIDTTTINGLSNGSLIGSVLPAAGINFVANEIQQGNVYVLEITGGANYTIGTNSTFGFTFGSTTINYSPTYTVLSVGVKPYFRVEAVFTIRGAVGAACSYQLLVTHTASGNANNSSITYTNALVATGTVNTTAGFTLASTYLSANTGDNLTCYNMTLIKQ